MHFLRVNYVPNALLRCSGVCHCATPVWLAQSGSTGRASGTRLHALSKVSIGLFASLSLIVSVSPTYADALDRIRERGTLIWGADEEGAARLSFRDEHGSKPLARVRG